ncbi:MAG: hypothetical protein IT497_05150, partial [Ottowia sp.]|nr:hypothetical protein [Ottowia sp.]
MESGESRNNRNGLAASYFVSPSMVARLRSRKTRRLKSAIPGTPTHSSRHPQFESGVLVNKPHRRSMMMPLPQHCARAPTLEDFSFEVCHALSRCTALVDAIDAQVERIRNSFSEDMDASLNCVSYVLAE